MQIYNFVSFELSLADERCSIVPLLYPLWKVTHNCIKLIPESLDTKPNYTWKWLDIFISIYSFLFTNIANKNFQIYLLNSLSESLWSSCCLSSKSSIWLPTISNSPLLFTNENLLSKDMKRVLVTEESVIEAKQPMASCTNDPPKKKIIKM